MSTTTIEDQLTELRRRADRLQALAGEIPEHTGIWRHVHAVRGQEAAVLTAARETPDAFDEKLGQLKTRLAVAERSLAADLSDDWVTFAEAVEEELRSWDILSRAAPGDGGDAPLEGTQAGGGGDRRPPKSPPRGRPAPRRGARRRTRGLAGATQAGRDGPRRARAERRRTHHNPELKGGTRCTWTRICRTASAGSPTSGRSPRPAAPSRSPSRSSS